LCGIAATDDTLSCPGWLSLMSSQRTARTCPFTTLSSTSFSTKFAMASGSSADLCGPRLMAAWRISPIVPSRPVLVGHPRFSHSLSCSAPSCLGASHCGAISFASNIFSLFLRSSSGRIVASRCFFHWPLIGCSRNV